MTAIESVAIADGIVENLPRGRAYLTGQLHSSATSIPLDMADGAGEFNRKDKARFYRMALRSATECATTLDVCHCLNLLEAERRDPGRDLLLRTVSMLTQTLRNLGESITGRGTERRWK